MELLLSGIMQMAKTTTSKQSRAMLLHGASLQKHLSMAFAYLLEKVSWTGMSEFKAGLTASRTRQLCDVMTVSKDLMANLLLSAGGRAGISVGGGGSNGELTNWDGTKKKTGWGM